MFSREDDLDPAARLADLDDHRPDPFVDAVRFAGDLLAAGQKSLDLAQVDRGGASVETCHRPGDHRAPQFLVLDVQRVPLGLAELLDHHLLGGLGGDSAEDGAEVIGGELDSGTVHRRFAGHPVDMHLHLRLLAVVPSSSRENRLLDALEDDPLVDVLVSVDRVDQPEEFGSVHRCSFPAGYPLSGHPNGLVKSGLEWVAGVDEAR